MIIRVRFCCIITLSLIFSPLSKICAQTTLTENSKHKIEFSIGYGDQQFYFLGSGVKLNADYSYEILFAQFQYMYSLLNKNSLELCLLLQSEFGITYYKPSKSIQVELRSHEIGFSAGTILSFSVINDFFNAYLLFSAGPHYSQKTPDRQISGFMFNSNANVGINIYMQSNLLFDLRTGFRHLSNANLKFPNRGINNLIISIGLIYNLGR
jgi:hypothetical protein